MTDGKAGSDRISFKIGVYGALSALAGELIGAVASIAITWWGFEREEDAANRSAEESAYIEFLKVSEAFVFSLRHGDGLQSPGDAPTLDRVLEAQSLVILYGSDDARDASGAMVSGIGAGIGDPENEKHRESPESWREYDDAQVEFYVAVQVALEID